MPSLFSSKVQAFKFYSAVVQTFIFISSVFLRELGDEYYTISVALVPESDVLAHFRCVLDSSGLLESLSNPYYLVHP